jgi:hypothetical protein
MDDSGGGLPMNDKYRATPQELEAQIAMCPKEIMPNILTAVIRHCIKHNVFNSKPLHKVVETLENNLTGYKKR